MPDRDKGTHHDFPGDVGVRERRKLRARKKKTNEVWFGLGMFGLVGWSVAVPTFLSTILGLWIDLKWPSPYSWTLMLLIIGVLLGCGNAWYWVNREMKRIERERADDGP